MDELLVAKDLLLEAGLLQAAAVLEVCRLSIELEGRCVLCDRFGHYADRKKNPRHRGDCPIGIMIMGTEDKPAPLPKR